MKPSTDVRDTMLRFYDRLSASDVGSFDELVAMTPATLVIGTAPGEWVTERERLMFGFETEGVRMEGDDPQGWEEGTAGWVVDQPTLFYPDGSSIKTRLTAIMQKVGRRWKIVNAHFSVGVPDEEVVELQKRWSGQSPAR
jgi:hypothetical protein